MIRVLVADDQAAVRDGFAALIDAQENMLLAGQASNGREAVDLARRDPETPPPELAELTDRERDILLLVAHGLSNAEIAGQLVISPLTAKSHARNIMRKLDCHDRASLVALAYETRLITPGEPTPTPRAS